MNPELWRKFRLDMERRNLSPATIATRRATLNRFLTGRDPAVVTSDDIEEWLDKLNIGPRTRSIYIAALHSFFEWAERMGQVASDPTRSVRRPRLPRLVPHPISEADLAFALENAAPKMRAWLALGALEGFRCVEISGLRREDIRVDRDPPVIIVSTSKGSHQAVLALNVTVEQTLREYGLPESGWVFRNRHGGPVHPNTVSCLGNRFLHSLGIAATMHSLRHFYVTQVYRTTRDIRVTQEAARHQDPRVTAGYAAFDDSLAVSTVRNLKVNGFRIGQHAFPLTP